MFEKMPKRANQLRNDGAGTSRWKKTKRNVNNNHHEDSDVNSDSDSDVQSGNRVASSSQIESIRCGKVQIVKLRNFMCHENLMVEFNKHANLLIGKNGSGKSAVLTALIIGLGSKATATDRSNSIKQLIRTGESSATIEVHLSNDGIDSYERDIFGDRIIVVRQISASGSSTYKLKNMRGEVVSTKRVDLQKMIFYLNIQVDNPVCVLTQDASRSFLHKSDPKKRFELFLKATQMDVIIAKLLGCSDQIRAAKARYGSQREQSELLKKKVDEARMQIDKINSLNPMKEKINQLKRAKKWALVINQEELLQEIKQMLDDTTKAKDDEIRATETRATELERMQELLAEANACFEATTQAIEVSRQTYDTERNSFRQTNERLNEHTRELKKIEAKKERIERDIATIEANIANGDSSNAAKLKLEHKQQIGEHKRRTKEIETIIVNTNRDIEMLNNTKIQKGYQFSQLRNEQTQNNKDLELTTQKYSQQNRASPADMLRMYGQHMPSLVNDIKRLHETRKLSKLPIGPVGSFIEVIDPKYIKSIEDLCKKILHAFIVDNPADMMELKNLIRTKYTGVRAPPIVCTKFHDRMYDVRGKRVERDQRYVVLMDLVKIDNPNVMNCFIDQIKADSVVFVEDHDIATKLTSSIENVPQNLAKVVLLDPYSEYLPAPSYRTYSRNVVSARFLHIKTQSKSSTEDYFKSELQKLGARKLQIEAAASELQKKSSTIDTKLTERKNAVTHLENELSAARQKIYELETYEYPEEIKIAQNEVEEQNKRLAETIETLSQAEIQMRRLETEVTEMDRKLKDIRTNMKRQEQNRDDKRQEIDKIQEEISKWASTAGYVERKLQKINLAITKYTSECNSATEKLQKLMQVAERAGNRIEMGQSEAELDELIKAQEKRISMTNSSSCTIEQAKANFEKCRKDYDENEKIVKSLGDALKATQDSTIKRYKSVKMLKHHMISRIEYYFTKLMSLRKFDGKLVFESEKKVLEIKVIPRDKQEDTVASSTNSLSGGERSYATVAFLMSLWKCVDHPFFFLDEYDVFTDHVNRKYLTDILLNEAAKHLESQYTFLTPQDISGVEPSEKLTVQRLKEPSR